MLVLGFLGNLTVILVIQYSQLRSQPGYVLVTSLASADLGVSLFVTAAKVKHYQQNGNFCSSLAFCVFQNFTDGLFPTASITHLLFICINRFCAITSPYSYHSLVTHTREIVVVVCVWFYCLLWTSAGMVTWDASPRFAVNVLSNGLDRICYSYNALFYVCAAIFVFIIPVVVAGVLYVIIVFIAIEKIQSTPSVKGEDTSRCDDLSLCQTKGDQVQRRSSSARGAKTLMLVFTAWVFCWMPHFLLILVNFWNPLLLADFQMNHGWLSEFVATIVSDVLPCLNSCINPLIYFFTSSIFRHALKDSWLKLHKKPRHRAGSVAFLKVKSFQRQISGQISDLRLFQRQISDSVKMVARNLRP